MESKQPLRCCFETLAPKLDLGGCPWGIQLFFHLFLGIRGSKLAYFKH